MPENGAKGGRRGETAMAHCDQAIRPEQKNEEIKKKDGQVWAGEQQVRAALKAASALSDELKSPESQPPPFLPSPHPNDSSTTSSPPVPSP